MKQAKITVSKMSNCSMRVGYSCDKCKCGKAMPTCCPLGTFAYHGGSHCCKEKNDLDGKLIGLHSDSCFDHRFFQCFEGSADGACETCSIIFRNSSGSFVDFKEHPEEGDSGGRVVCSTATHPEFPRSCYCLHPEFPGVHSEVAKSLWG